MTSTAMEAVPGTSFLAAGVRERADIQRLLQANIEVVSPDTLIISEEFGAWDASARRIDLLGIDRDANLVVIELKRDDTGAHMELQALRYAAMVARMTFDQAVTTYQAHLARSRVEQTVAAKRLNRPAAEVERSTEDARTALLEFLGWEEPEEASFAQEVRVVLVAADFSRELMTSVMWLNERDLDIRCVQLQPYKLGDQLLLQVDQVIPLREASEYQVQVREKARRERAAKSTTTRDLTRFDLTIGDKRFTRLPKRRLIYQVVRYLIETLRKSPEEIEAIVEHPRPWVQVDGEFDAAGFQDAVAAEQAKGGPRVDLIRCMCDDDELLRFGGRTYALTKMWGTNTIPSLEALRERFTDATFHYEPSAGE
jgi:hypothetical protein